MTPYRAFIAVNVPPLPGLRRLIGHLERLGRAVKPVNPEHLHLTLRFIGDMDAAMTEPVLDAMRSAAAEQGPSCFQLVGLGAFPRPQRPSVIWADIDPPDALVRLADRLNCGLDALGLPAERRPFTPHLTVARLRIGRNRRNAPARPPAALTDLMQRFATEPWGEVSLTHLTLMKSTLTPQGPIYEPMGQAPLGTDADPTDGPP